MATIDTLHFDEAWLPHAAFHRFLRHIPRHGQEARRAARTPMVFATQSTHKLLAGTQPGQRRCWCRTRRHVKLDRHLFNEAYLMHTSTSPQYAIIASCDVAAAMMEPPGGTALVEESIAEALDFRRAMRKVDEEYGDDWWFKVWGPDKLAEEGIGTRERLDAQGRSEQAGTASASWRTGFNMLDPIKATIVTPGLDVDGKFAETGIPAAIVTKFLAEHGVVVEKTGLYSLLHHVHHRHHQGPLEHAC